MDGSVVWVRVPNLLQGPLQGAAKLHGFIRCQFCCLHIDATKGMVHCEPWSPFMLGDDAQGRPPQTRQVFCQMSRQQSKETFVDKVQHLLSQERLVVLARLMGSSFSMLAQQLLAPWCGRPDYRHTILGMIG